jgi:hypothetical protein
MHLRWIVTATFATATALSAQAGPIAPRLPKPTGRFAVGRVADHWIDSSRTEPCRGGERVPN